MYTDGFFSVDETNGFLPIRPPLASLPETFTDLQILTDSLKDLIKVPDAIVGSVLALPNYLSEVSAQTDPFVLQALFRAYTFVASAYTLELAYQEFVKSGEYGQARKSLPPNIAQPLDAVGLKLDVYPWLDYHYAYSLGNYVKKDPSGSLDWRNLQMACSFTGGQDETGFIMVHVYINELSPQLIQGIKTHDLKLVAQTIQSMNSRRREMWEASRHERYNDFRVFIMGIKGNNKIFGDGVVYEGCDDLNPSPKACKSGPRAYRGQTGAQDNIIPTLDIFTGIVDYYPQNQLTDYLMDLRSYRPVCVQKYLSDLRDRYNSEPLITQLIETNNVEGLVWLLEIVDQVYLFRNGHWQFVQKYIMSNVKYAFATGGTPITTWLINQIEAVLEYERIIIGQIKLMGLASDDQVILDTWAGLEAGYSKKIQLLQTQVAELAKADYDIKLVYGKNQELNLDDASMK